MSAEAIAVQKLAMRLATEILNREIADARLAILQTELASIRAELEALMAKAPASKRKRKGAK